MEVFGCIGLALVAIIVGLGAAHNIRARLHPIMFAQATVIKAENDTALFRLFDGQELRLRVGKACLYEGDYGRLTWQGNRCREFVRMKQ